MRARLGLNMARVGEHEQAAGDTLGPLEQCQGVRSYVVTILGGEQCQADWSGKCRLEVE